MTEDEVYYGSEDDFEDTLYDEPKYRLRDRVSDKRIEKHTKQALARKRTKKGTRNVTQIRKGTDARDVRASRPREVSLLQESSDRGRF